MRTLHRVTSLLPGCLQVMTSGDLVVQCLEPSDVGLYTCTVFNTVKPYLFDRVHTWLVVPKGAPAIHQVLLSRTKTKDTEG